MTDITAELVRKMTIKSVIDEIDEPTNIWFTVDVVKSNMGEDIFDLTVTVRDPWTYEPISSCKPLAHFPTSDDYAFMIAHILKMAHPSMTITYSYYPINRRIIIEYVEEAQPWKKKKEENKLMEHYELTLVKLVTNGPATIGWFMTPYKRDLRKVVVKRAEGEYDDPEKAILALYMKALSGGHTQFHSRMNKAMKMMYAAIDKEREIEEAKLAREEKIDHTFGENIVESFKETFNATEVNQEITNNINDSLNRLTSYANRLKDTVKKMELNSVYGANNAKVEKKGESWTWDEVSFLHRHYSSRSTKSIAMALGRSEYAVRSKAKRLGIKKGR